MCDMQLGLKLGLGPLNLLVDLLLLLPRDDFRVIGIFNLASMAAVCLQLKAKFEMLPELDIA